MFMILRQANHAKWEVYNNELNLINIGKHAKKMKNNRLEALK